MTKEIMEMEIEAWSLWQKWGEGGGGAEGSRGVPRERPRRHTYTLERPAAPRSLARRALGSPSVPTREDVAVARALSVPLEAGPEVVPVPAAAQRRHSG